MENMTKEHRAQTEDLKSQLKKLSEDVNKKEKIRKKVMDTGYLNKVMEAHTKYDSMVKEMSSEILSLQDQLNASYSKEEGEESGDDEG